MTSIFYSISRFRCLLFAVLLSFLTGCFEGEAEQLAEDGDKVSSARAGQVYYQDNCSVCHSVNLDDTTSAFQATDLARKRNPLGTNLSIYGGAYKLMNRFSHESQKDIDNLEAYLATF